jgi:uncharacterized membrane protein
MNGRWNILLVVSLVLNLFLAGAIGGAVVVGTRFLGERDGRRGDDGRRVNQAFAALAPERRDQLREIMRAQALNAAEDVALARQARVEAVELASAESYDPVAVGAALERARAADGRARARIDTALAARLAEFTQEERAQFSRLLLRGGYGLGEQRGRNDGDRHRRQGPPQPGPQPAPRP